MISVLQDKSDETIDSIIGQGYTDNVTEVEETKWINNQTLIFFPMPDLFNNHSEDELSKGIESINITSGQNETLFDDQMLDINTSEEGYTSRKVVFK